MAQSRPRAARPPAPLRSPSPKLRVLVISHGHPAFTVGGAEIAAHGLYQGLLAQPDCEAWFLGCDPDAAVRRAGVGITQPLGPREYIYQTGTFDFFKFANRDADFPAEFMELLLELRPDIVHFHHFVFVGVEAFDLVRRSLPQARIVLTVHEYLLICNASGQMVTRSEQTLCYCASLEACHVCFPEVPPQDFFLRKTYIQRFITNVDAFISPSHFLATRLCEWGLAPGQIAVIENVVAPAECSPVGPATTGPLRVGFFGQLSRLKGLAVLFEAAATLEAEDSKVVFEIHGTYRGQTVEFQEEFVRLLSAAGQTVRFHGGYRPQDVDGLMRKVDLVIVPSIWWENSPVVIQEAMRNRRPVICSEIGGMVEKVRAGRDGWHFAVGNVAALVALLQELESDRSRVTAMAESMTHIQSVTDIIQAHTAIYRQLSINKDAVDR